MAVTNDYVEFFLRSGRSGTLFTEVTPGYHSSRTVGHNPYTAVCQASMKAVLWSGVNGVLVRLQCKEQVAQRTQIVLFVDKPNVPHADRYGSRIHRIRSGTVP